MKRKSRMFRPALKILSFVIVCILFFSLSLPAAPAAANGNRALHQSALFLLRGDVTSVGVGLRGTGTGVMHLRAVPAGAFITRAYLYWATLGSTGTYTSPTLNGQPVGGALIGTSGDTCWGVQHNYSYRADVTRLVTGNGNYTIAGLPNSLVSGNDSQGASLVVIYSLASDPYRTILIQDGAVSLNDTITSYTDTLNGFTITQPVTNAHITYLIGDGQSTLNSGNVMFNGYSLATNVLTGIDGPMWGTHTFIVTRRVTSPPVATSLSDFDAANPTAPDCILWVATIFSVTSPAPVYNHTIYLPIIQHGASLAK